MITIARYLGLGVVAAVTLTLFVSTQVPSAQAGIPAP